MKTYIWKKQKGYYVNYDEEIDSKYWEGKIGTTYEDFLDNKWVLLSAEQVAFHESNPTASVKEVWDMEIESPYIPPTPTPSQMLREKKREKIQEIDEYNESDAVNVFTLGNIEMWLTVKERQQIATQINANKAISREEMTRWYNGVPFTFPLGLWEQMLVALEVYAGDALNVTEAHKAAVTAMESIEDIDNFDITADYPEKLVFAEIPGSDEMEEEI